MSKNCQPDEENANNKKQKYFYALLFRELNFGCSELYNLNFGFCMNIYSNLDFGQELNSIKLYEINVWKHVRIYFGIVLHDWN